MIWDKSSASYAHTLAQKSIYVKSRMLVNEVSQTFQGPFQTGGGSSPILHGEKVIWNIY